MKDRCNKGRWPARVILPLLLLLAGLVVPTLSPAPAMADGPTTPMVSAAGYLTVGLKSDGTVVAVGWNGQGQLDVTRWSDIVQVSAGTFHTVGLKSNGTVVAVGSDQYGKCDVNSWTEIQQVSAGYGDTVGLESDGTVVAVGWGEEGQLEVSGWRDIVQVSAGEDHTVGLKSDGTVVAVGSDQYGQRDVSGWRDIVQVSAGVYHTVGLKSDGTVVAVGRNNEGQCIVSGWRDIVQVSAGYDHTVGLKSDGTVVAVGWNGQGQLDVSVWRDIVQVSAGVYHTVGLKSDGKVFAVGRNNEGQCIVGGWDLGVTIPNRSPIQPTNTLPANGATGQTLTPTLQSSAFSDPDAGDTQTASQWQVRISSGNYSSPVFDSGTTNTSLSSVAVSSGSLSYSTTYYWHVRHEDNHRAWSSWSAETSFTTADGSTTGAVSGTFLLGDGSGNVTYDSATGIDLTGNMTFSCSITGDLVGTGVFDMTYNAADKSWYGASQAATATLTVDGIPRPAIYIVGKGRGYNWVTYPPNPDGSATRSLDCAAEVTVWTTDGSNLFARLEMSGRASGTWNWPAPGQTVITNGSGSGTWGGTLQTITTSPQVLPVNQPGPGIATLTDPWDRTIAQLLYDTASSSGTFVLAQYENNPGGLPVRLPLGKYVAADTNIISPLINWPVELRIYYTDAEVAAAGINENTLRLYRWDGSTWTQVAESGVNTLENYVWGTLYSLSDYGAMGYPAGCDQVSSATGTGTVTLCPDAGTFANLSAVRETSILATGKPSLVFPHGFFEFEIAGLTPGESVTLTITLPSDVPIGAQYWKYGPTPSEPLGEWYQIPLEDDDGDNVIVIILTDGGRGDDDLVANGVIVDQGGPGWPSGGGVPVFPSVYVGTAAALGAGVVAYVFRRRLARR